jgi:uncharacterized BrkB/YihY/UPF0761 family membrane protein
MKLCHYITFFGFVIKIYMIVCFRVGQSHTELKLKNTVCGLFYSELLIIIESLSFALYVKRQTPGKEKFYDIRQ